MNEPGLKWKRCSCLGQKVLALACRLPALTLGCCSFCKALPRHVLRYDRVLLLQVIRRLDSCRLWLVDGICCHSRIRKDAHACRQLDSTSS